MIYYINDYSLTGQFKDVDEFLSSIREYTLPVLKKIEENRENIVWKKDTFWQSKICKDITLSTIPRKQNERTAEIAAIQLALIKLVGTDPFWSEFDESNVEICEYKFDEVNRDKFSKNNCFTKAINNEGMIISFIHAAYKSNNLEISIRNDGIYENIFLDNIFSIDCLKCSPVVKSWRFKDRYIFEVRAKEFDYHPPHFHVSQNEYSAVFKINDCTLYDHGKKKLPGDFLVNVARWYSENRDILKSAWSALHPKLPYRKEDGA